MNMVNQFQKDTLDTLGVLYKNYLLQKKDKIEVFLNDFRSGSIDPETFFDTVHTLKQKGFEIKEYDHDWMLSKEQEMGARNTPCCEVTLPKDFEDFYKKTTSGVTDSSGRKRLIKKDANGDYFYNSKSITFAKDTLPFKIFDALYSHSDQEGFLSYKDIETYLVKSGELESETEEKRNKRIINAVSGSQGLFRFAKINKQSLENKIPSGAALLEIRKGKGLRLNNPAI